TLAAALVLGDRDEAARLCDAVEQASASAQVPNSFLIAEITFWHALSLAARYEKAEAHERKTLWATLEGLQAGLDDLATRGTILFRAWALLLAAERARVTGNAERAASQYDLAVSAARESGSLRLEGLAAELGGRHALARGLGGA